MCHRLKIQPQMLVRPVSGHKARNTWPILNVWLLFLCFYFKTDHTHTQWWVALGKQKLDENTQCRDRATVLFSITLWSAGSSTVSTGEKRAAEWGQRALMVLAFEGKLAGMNFFHAASLPEHGSMSTAMETAQTVKKTPAINSQSACLYECPWEASLCKMCPGGRVHWQVPIVSHFGGWVRKTVWV